VDYKDSDDDDDDDVVVVVVVVVTVRHYFPNNIIIVKMVLSLFICTCVQYVYCYWTSNLQILILLTLHSLFDYFQCLLLYGCCFNFL